MSERSVYPKVVEQLEMDDRDRYDQWFRAATHRIIDAIPLIPSFEAAQEEAVRRITIDSDRPSEKDLKRLKRSFPSGTFLFHSAKSSNIVKILQAGSLMNAASIDAVSRDSNGGSEGISWSLNDIEAMPATRYHIAGFVAAPEKILKSSTQLAVPDSAAPFEVVQLSQQIDATDFYDRYARARSLEEQYRAAKEARSPEERLLMERIMAQKLFLQDSVQGSRGVRVPVEDLFFVAAAQDMPVWSRVLARCGTKPAGVITYDGSEIQREDFVQNERGDGRALAGKLRKVIPPSGDTVTFASLIGRSFEESMRRQDRPHLIDDVYREGSKHVVYDQGRLQVK